MITQKELNQIKQRKKAKWKKQKNKGFEVNKK
jgi:hypothetical protein